MTNLIENQTRIEDTSEQVDSICVRIDKDVYVKLKELATQFKIPVSAILRCSFVHIERRLCNIFKKKCKKEAVRPVGAPNKKNPINFMIQGWENAPIREGDVPIELENVLKVYGDIITRPEGQNVLKEWETGNSKYLKRIAYGLRLLEQANKIKQQAKEQVNEMQ